MPGAVVVGVGAAAVSAACATPGERLKLSDETATRSAAASVGRRVMIDIFSPILVNENHV
jgi:hypothetical protein